MSFALLPNLIANSLTELSPQLLTQRGIKLLMLDFDNTIVPYTTNQPTEQMADWLRMMRNSDIQICVVSNSKKERVKLFCKAWEIDCITHSRKPFSDGIGRCLAQYSIPKENCAIVGDQIYTDVLGGNCAGIQSILVKSIDNHNFWLKARHVLEKPWIFAARKRRIEYEKS